MFTSTLFLIPLFFQFVYASCGRRTTHDTGFALPKFGYDPVSIGPMNWHNMNPDWYLCANGTHQAPINIISESTPTVSAKELHFDIPTAYEAEFENLGTTLEVLINGTFVAGGVTHHLKQFHFHVPGEHHIDGMSYAQEVHFVTQSDSGQTSVIAFLMELASSKAPQTVLDSLADYADTISEPGSSITIPKLRFGAFLRQYFSDEAEFFSLEQSLTTPPCTEGIHFYIATKPIPLSIRSWKRFKKVIKFNARFIQGALGNPNVIQIASTGA